MAPLGGKAISMRDADHGHRLRKTDLVSRTSLIILGGPAPMLVSSTSMMAGAMPCDAGNCTRCCLAGRTNWPGVICRPVSGILDLCQEMQIAISSASRLGILRTPDPAQGVQFSRIVNAGKKVLKCWKTIPTSDADKRSIFLRSDRQHSASTVICPSWCSPRVDAADQRRFFP